jgi:hypothetical protein
MTTDTTTLVGRRETSCNRDEALTEEERAELICTLQEIIVHDSFPQSPLKRDR